MKLTVRALVLAFVLAATGCQQPLRVAGPTLDVPPPASSPAWGGLVDEYIESGFAYNPPQGVRAGRHEFDGQLPQLTRESFQKRIAQLRDLRERARAFDVAGLDARQRFEREYLIAQITSDLFWLEVAENPYRNPAYYAFVLSPDVYAEREYAPLDQRLRAYTKYLRAVPAATVRVRENLRTPMPRTFAALGHNIFGGMARFYEHDAPGVFAAVKDAQLQREFAAANAEAVPAMKALDGWFEAQQATANDDFAFGPEKFRRMLRETEDIDIALARLKEMGERDLERNLAALRAECARFAPGATPQACVEKMQERKPADGPVTEALRQLPQLRQFLVDHGVVTIPSAEVATVGEAPAYRRWNAAYISNPGPYEKNVPSIYFIAPPDPAWTPAEREAYIPDVDTLLLISLHEVWPGHFLQHLHAKRAYSKLGTISRSYAFGEGWAHYCEEMMWEMGLGAGDSAVHIAQIVDALLRDVRYLSALGLHTGGMTVAQSEAMFREKAFQDPGNARQQAARGTFDPAYGNYTLGKLMIRELRDDWTATRGGRSAWRAFHDQFLSYGSPPIPLVRKTMMGSDLKGAQ
jgi:uncharacterized protein (DUF885 family)